MRTDASGVAPISTCSTALSWTAKGRWARENLADGSCAAVLRLEALGYGKSVICISAYRPNPLTMVMYGGGHGSATEGKLEGGGGSGTSGRADQSRAA